ncbi:hypothetical protein R7D97_17030 [Vibrio sp. Vb5031]|uniref:Uncharacterized protein n=1 Tax=Vibrio hepatarius TaxID=171383 RepID=A0A0M0HYY3_9VIBR|nr:MULTISPECIES: hypothetical protein [Vibrio]KOO06843.1 hypothetical protein AKJ31_14125 [Vibrio hepatarius]MCR9821705.1 hypothetical protein [Vibrio parahaemolyticus]MDW1505890.1 hypothetical protein [Vibrio sp. Vb5031]MDW1517093.1 hypothetical protein [Vibrio sp. Vb5035]MDW1547269.1 hypothetical protein [Vibrio sp. Vb5034]
MQTTNAALTTLNEIAEEHSIPVQETVHHYHQCRTVNHPNRYTSGLVVRNYEQATQLNELASASGLSTGLHTFGFSSIVFIKVD